MDSHSLEPGDQWEVEIEAALDTADVLCVFVSTDAVASDRYFCREYKLGLDKFSRRPPERSSVIPIRLSESALPVELHSFQWVDLETPEWQLKLEGALRKCAGRLNRLVEPLSDWHFNRARALREKGENILAVSEINAAIELKPDEGRYHLLRATCLVALRDFDKALSDLRLPGLLEVDKKQAYALSSRALRGLRRFDEAVDSAQRIVDDYPTCPSGYFERAQAYERKRYIKKALADYESAIAKDAARWEYHAGQARCLSELQLDEAAFQAFDRALLLNPRDPDLLLQRAHALVQAAQFAALESGYRDALADLDCAIDLDPQSGACHAERGWVLWRTGNEAAAAEAFDRAKQYASTDARVYFSSGLFLQERGDHEGAVADLSMAIKIDPRDPENFAARGSVYRVNGMFREAIDDFSAAISLQPENKEYFKYRGDCYQAIDDMRSALNDYQRFLGGEPGSGE